MQENEKQEKKDVPESELLKLQREKYEAIIADKNKIIADLLKAPAKENKKDEEAEEVDEEAEALKDEEKRKKKRMAYYKENIIL